MITAEEVKAYAKARGADLVGIAPMERFEGITPDRHPASIFPEAKAVVVMGFRILRGLLRGIEEGTYWQGYSYLGYGGINQIWAPTTLRDTCIFIEDRGFEAVPVPNVIMSGGWNQGVPVAPGRPPPNVFINYRHAAVAAGLGEIGYSKLFLSPQFGPRQRIALLITDAPLKPDPMFQGEICDRCMLCVKECPAGAISPDKTVKRTVGGREFEWGELDVEKCRSCHSGELEKVSPFLKKARQKDPDIKARDVPFHRGLEYLAHYLAICGARGCMRACFDHLERTGTIQARFQEPFKKRKPWVLTE